MNSNILVTSSQGNAFAHMNGKKLYELSNHLGKVLVTVCDARIGVKGESESLQYNPNKIPKISLIDADSILIKFAEKNAKATHPK